MRYLVPLSCMLLFAFMGCGRKIAVDPQTAREMIIHRNLGVAHLEENNLEDAIGEFQKLVDIAPQEPLGYANVGLAYLRMGEYEQAEEWLQEALNLEPHNPDIGLLLAKVYEINYRENEAISILENTLEKHPDHAWTLHQLAQYYINTQEPEALLKAEDCLILVVDALPANVAARMQLIELLVGNGKPDQAIYHMETIRQVLPELPEGSLETFQRALELLHQGDTEQAFAPARIFHNLLKPTTFYQAAITELKGIGGGIAGRPIYRFSQDVSLKIQEQAGIPDAINFTDVTAASGLDIISPSDVPESSDDNPQIIMALGDYESDGDQDIFISQWLPVEQTSRQYLFANDNGTFSDIADHAGVSHNGRDLYAIFADYDNDGYLDLFVTNTQANRLYHNTGEGTFRDLSATAGIQTASAGRRAVFADLDLEGDLDLFIATSSLNQLFRNNSNGEFTEIAEKAGIVAEVAISRDVIFGDFDDDGDIDLIVVNQDASNRYYDNLRQSYFRDVTEQSGLGTDGGSGSAAVGDYDNDGYQDLFITDLNGARHSLFHNLGDGTFERDIRSSSAFESIDGIAGLDATFFDADNDGFLDLLVAGMARDITRECPGLWLFYNDGEGKYLDASSLLPGLVEIGSQVEVTDYDNDGDLDIILAGYHAIHLLRNDGGNVNNYLVVRLAGLRTGSTKNNYFGLGAKVEMKAGPIYQMRIMTDPIAHFGLGQLDSAEVVRVVWSNGVPQNRLNLERNQTILENQILKGSCPWLFAWNGQEYEFVTDVLWASALGMPLGIMGGEIGYAFANSTDEYLMIPGEKLQPRNGRYSLQFTDELWESPYVDRIELLVVDHPDSVDVFIDERFTPPPFPPLRIYMVAEKQLPVSARDSRGNNILEEIAHQDGKYVSNLTPTLYQGIMETHDLILDLGDLSQSDSVFLFLHSWVFPTDASINVNLAQSGVINVTPPSVQVVDEQGNWKTVIENLGYAKGKNKMVVVDLSDKFITDDYQIRVRTNMQIYWDHVFYTTRVTGSPLRIINLEPVAADLHYRGFSEVSRETPYSPHIPDYQTVNTEPIWRDLTGLYTRYGNVSTLLLESDSRYVIMNSGDELSIEFDASQVPELPPDWSRDYIFYNDGWLKDGDLNTASGQTVQPLPFHGMSAYPYGPDESYPEDEEHQQFLREYITREVTTEHFRELIRDWAQDN